MRFMAVVAVAFLGLMVWVHDASASTINVTIDFTASDFTIAGGLSDPHVPVTGSISVTLDPTQGYLNETSGITLNALSIGAPAVLTFTHNLVGALAIIGDDGGAGHNGFALLVFFDDPTPFGSFGFTQLGDTKNYLTFTGSATITPLPGSVIMLLTALGALGGVGVLRAGKVKQPVLAA